jgi:hypothetical protein
VSILAVRAEENPARRPHPTYRNVTTNSTRHVDEWLPTHAWPLAEVPARIRRG